MKHIAKKVLCPAFMLIFFLAGALPCHALSSGQAAPLFALQDLNGKKYDLAAMKKNTLMVVYFFDAQSRPSQEGLLNLDQLAKKYKDANLTVWGITGSSKKITSDFISKTKPSFPVLMDNASVSDRYNARLILPTVCIIGPDLKVLDLFQGGGKTMNVMLVRLAERKLQQQDMTTARLLSEDLAKKNPENDQAAAISGYAALKAGKVADAEKKFSQMAKGKGKAEILGKEGLAAVYVQQGKADKALKLAHEVEQKAPGRAYPHVVKGEILARQNKKQEAKAEYEAAIHKSDAETYQKALAYNKLGRLYSGVKDYKKSRELYDQAVELDPYYVEAMSNKGVTYEKEGDWNKALESYQKSQGISRDDTFSKVLASRAIERLEYMKDSARRDRVDKLVKDLSERFRENKKNPRNKSEDTWTSPPLVMGFIDFQEFGLSDRDGISTVLTSQLAEQLNASGRVKMVDRIVLDRLLEELNLGSSEAADPETSLKLGRVLSARVMGTGTIYTTPGFTMVNMRLIDSETTAINKVINIQLPTGIPQQKDLYKLNRQILGAVIKDYPLHAYVMNVENGQAMINLGSNQGVVVGTKFNVIGAQKEIEYKGKKLKSSLEITGRLETVKTEPDFSYCKIVTQQLQIQKDDKITEL